MTLWNGLPTVAEGNTTNFGLIKEVTAGVSPAGNYLGFPCAQCNISWQPENATLYSRGVRQATRAVGGQCSGSVSGGLVYFADTKGHVHMIQGGMRNTFPGTAQYTASTITTTKVSNDVTYTDSANGLPVFLPGVPVRIVAPDEENEGYFTCVTSTASALTVRNSAGSAQAAGGEYKFVGDMMVNGVQKHSFTTEMALEDINEFFPGTNFGFNGFKISASQGGFLNFETQVMGNVWQLPTAVTASGAAYDSGIDDSVYDSHGNMKLMTDGFDYHQALQIESLEMEIMNGLELRKGVGFEGPSGHRYGNFDAKISANLGYSGKKWFERGRGATQMAYSVLFESPGEDAFAVTVFNASVVSGGPNGAQSGSDVGENLVVEANKLAGTARTMAAITRYPQVT